MTNYTDIIVDNIDLTTAFFMREMHRARKSTLKHSIRVAYYAVCLTYDQTDQMGSVVRGSLLHDIGKLAIGESILYKPDKLNNSEYMQIKEHPGIGYQMAKEVGITDETVLSIIRDHHEKLNGHGYARMIRDIPYLTQIVTICDIYDALTSERVYKDAQTAAEAKEILVEHAVRGEISEDLIYEICAVPVISEIEFERIYSTVYEETYNFNTHMIPIENMHLFLLNARALNFVRPAM